MLSTGADGLDLDYQTDARVACGKMRDRAVFVGNLDPSGVVGLGSPELVEAKSRELLEIFADTPRFVLNAGCAIPASAPPESIRAMIRAAREP
jgi:uroporphyrinogen decarboxylase